MTTRVKRHVKKYPRFYNFFWLKPGQFLTVTYIEKFGSFSGKFGALEERITNVCISQPYFQVWLMVYPKHFVRTFVRVNSSDLVAGCDMFNSFLGYEN